MISLFSGIKPPKLNDLSSVSSSYSDIILRFISKQYICWSWRHFLVNPVVASCSPHVKSLFSNAPSSPPPPQCCSLVIDPAESLNQIYSVCWFLVIRLDSCCAVCVCMCVCVCVCYRCRLKPSLTCFSRLKKNGDTLQPVRYIWRNFLFFFFFLYLHLDAFGLKVKSDMCFMSWIHSESPSQTESLPQRSGLV